MKHNITFDEPATGSKYTNARVDGEYIGFKSLDNKNIYLQRCGECRKENYAPAVASGQCAWCGWDANGENDETH